LHRPADVSHPIDRWFLPPTTSSATRGARPGFWLEEPAAPYYVFKDVGAQITLASPKGGRPPLDPKCNEPSFQTDITRRFEKDADAHRPHFGCEFCRIRNRH
jgi:hypothetical protein